jgi:ParB-like chromosome segregation protein Spo0J
MVNDHDAAWVAHNPVAQVRWVPIEKVRANDYNPNSVAIMEMRLLYVSIKHDGYTQPVVTVYDAERDQYVIVDGFHRYMVMKRYPDIREANHGLLPVVVIDKPMNDRMASTVRHNRARGKHSVDGMSSLVVAMLQGGWEDVQICNELGLEGEELIRLKHLTGYAKFFANGQYSPAKETRNQINERLKYEKGEGS